MYSEKKIERIFFHGAIVPFLGISMSFPSKTPKTTKEAVPLSARQSNLDPSSILSKKRPGWS